MGKIKVNEIEKHDATEVTVNSDVVMAAGTSVSSPSISTDTISEKTSGSGVTIDGVKLKDNVVETNTISEGTSGSGVTIDGVLLKDSSVNTDTIAEKTSGSGVTIDGVNIKDGTITGANLGRKNYIINGNFDIWQRGTSGTGGYCSADRWYFGTSGATGTLAQGTFTAGQTDVPNNPRYYANLTTTVADDNTNILQRIEDVYTLAGETITVSFWAKHTTNAPTYFLVKTRQYFDGSTPVVLNSSAQTTTTSWQKYTLTYTLGSISGKTIGSNSRLELEITNPNNETFDFQIAQVQVEKGSVATDFEVRHIAEELALCQRYFYKTFVQSQAPAQNISPGRTVILNYTGAGSGATSFNFPQVMRATPTMTFYNPYAANSSFRQWNSGNDYTPSTVDVDEVQIKTFYFNGVNITGGHINYVADAEL